MPIVCIPQETANKIKEAIKGKDLKIADLFKIKETEARVKYLEKFAGDKAGEINALFEQKIILKNQFMGLKNFISKITQTGRYSKEKIAELQKSVEDWKAQQMERIFNPKEGEIALDTLADKIIGTHISDVQKGEFLKLWKATELFKKDFDGEKWLSEQSKKDYGASKVMMENFVNELKTGNLTLKEMLAERVSKFKDTYEVNKTKAITELLMDSLKFITDNSISMVATFDNSFMGRQGLKTLITHPKIWWEKDVKNSFSDIYKTLKGENARDALMAELYSDPKYLSGEYEMAGILKSKQIEEQFPSSGPAKIPVLGKFFTASENAFVGSALRSRTALYNKISDIAKNQGVDMTNPEQIKSIGKLVSSLTARGQWGKTGEPAIVRLLMWAPKMLKGNIDVLTAHLGQDITPFARKQAAVNLLKIVGTTATVMMVANAMKPGSAELDPRSTDFGKIKVGNTRFDITGGAASLVVLAARAITNSSKSSTSGNISKFGTGYGQTSRWDLLINFLEGKTTPPVRFVMDLLEGQNVKGEKATLGKELVQTFTPISIQNVIDLKDDNSTQAVLGAILDVIGVSANTYSISTDWTQNTGKELTAFREKVGDNVFKEANKTYDEQFNQWYLGVKLNPKFQALTQDQKSTVVSNKKSELKDKIMKSYGFTYKRAKSVKLPKL